MPASNPTGPSFRALFATTFLIVAAGGAAMAFGLPDLLTANDTSTRTVETEFISVGPSAETQAAATRSVAASGGFDARGLNDSSEQFATAAQIADAKARMRRALTVGSTGGTAALTAPAQVAAPAPVEAVAPRPAQAPFIVREVPPASEEATRSAPIDRTTPTAAAVPAAVAVARADTVQQEPPFSLVHDPAPKAEPLFEQESAPATAQALNDADQSTGKIVSAVNLRQSGQNGAAVIGVIPQGASVSFRHCDDWWCEVTYEGRSGFIAEKYLQR
ncbi:SH3 domain-containing protein [Roseibium aggregatum]|uniref:SH3 domain-containing protein n=1 Tax=Roseibium aggregatum TaxID=187304 RepID=A0A939J3H4_9HYPH|nr:SH3 domain-containing protein [Roseibium aggregatum]MBN9670125.1 SH3 domain-containing protein [Roseibium aggregatum]